MDQNTVETTVVEETTVDEQTERVERATEAAQSYGLVAVSPGSLLPESAKGKGGGHEDGKNSIPVQVTSFQLSLKSNNATGARGKSLRERVGRVMLANVSIPELNMEFVLPLQVCETKRGTTIYGGSVLSQQLAARGEKHALDAGYDLGLKLDPRDLDDCASVEEFVEARDEDTKDLRLVREAEERVENFTKSVAQLATSCGVEPADLKDDLKASLWASVGGTGEFPR